MNAMIFSFPHLKGYVTLSEDGKIEYHNADPDLKYMKHLAEEAEDVKKYWNQEEE